MSSGNPVDYSYTSAVAVTPSDTVPFTPPLRALYIGTASTVTLKVTTADGTVVTFANVFPGIIPISCKLVWATGTSATNIVGFR